MNIYIYIHIQINKSINLSLQNDKAINVLRYDTMKCNENYGMKNLVSNRHILLNNYLVGD